MEGGRRKREGGWVEERVLWIGSDWTGLVNELYCSIWLSSRKRGRGRDSVVLFLSSFFLFSFFANMKREERFTCVDLFCAFWSLALLHRHHSHHHRTNADGIGETYVANQQIGCVSESERCERIFLFFHFTSLHFTSVLTPTHTTSSPSPYQRYSPADFYSHSSSSSS